MIIVAFVRLQHVTRATSSAQVDPTKIADGSILLSLWSQIEAAVAVLVANLPAFRSLLGSGTTVGGRTAGKYTYQYRYPGAGSRSGANGTGGRGKFSGGGSGGGRRMYRGESSELRLSQTQIVAEGSLEMQRLPSEESNDGSRTELRDAGGGGIVMTTEFMVQSGRRSSFDTAEYEIPRPGQAFVPK